MVPFNTILVLLESFQWLKVSFFHSVLTYGEVIEYWTIFSLKIHLDKN